MTNPATDPAAIISVVVLEPIGEKDTEESVKCNGCGKIMKFKFDSSKNCKIVSINCICGRKTFVTGDK